MGHLDQRSQGIRSTKSSPTTTTPDPMEEPHQIPLNDKTNIVFMTMVDIKGPLGNKHTVIFYTVEVNHIKSYPIKTHHRTESFMLTMMCMHASSWVIAHSYTNLTTNPLTMWKHSSLRTIPASSILQTSIGPTLLNVQSTPGKTIFCHASWGGQISPPLQLDLEQTNITLKMICPGTQNPNFSAHEAIDGMFSLMASIGMECMIPSSLPASLVLCPGTQPLSLHQAITDTGAVSLADTFTFLRHTLPTSTIGNDDCIAKAIKNLCDTIKGHPQTQPDELE
ncbi:LOW QUALITY PROTEIN: hypothetical protein ACHAW6_001088, partial [Cyclotella cf. meneghiniana]